jgi:hypothetical protein
MVLAAVERGSRSDECEVAAPIITITRPLACERGEDAGCLGQPWGEEAGHRQKFADSDEADQRHRERCDAGLTAGDQAGAGHRGLQDARDREDDGEHAGEDPGDRVHVDRRRSTIDSCDNRQTVTRKTGRSSVKV